MLRTPVLPREAFLAHDVVFEGHLDGFVPGWHLEVKIHLGLKEGHELAHVPAQGSKTFVSLTSRLESHKEEEKHVPAGS